MIAHLARLACAATLLVAAAGASGIAQTVTPTYDADNKLRLPEGYEKWVFVGSNLGLAYKRRAPAMTALEAERANPQLFHNIYIDPAAYAAFLDTGRFPDPTVLVMENYTAEAKDTGGVITAGFFNGRRVMLEAAVKDSRRPTRPDSHEIWAYYTFGVAPSGRPDATAKAAADSECFACHKVHAGPDNVWVQFYPPLRPGLSK
jgi:hypothetical protein